MAVCFSENICTALGNTVLQSKFNTDTVLCITHSEIITKCGPQNKIILGCYPHKAYAHLPW